MLNPALLHPVDGPILTPNQRLARVVINQWSKAQSGDVWITPHILAMQAWLQQQWQTYSDHSIDTPQPLTTTQAQTWWRQWLQQQADLSLMNLNETAQTAHRAYQLIAQYAVSLTDPSWQLQAEHQQYHQWHQHYQNHCNAQGWLDPIHIPDALINAWQALPYLQPRAMILYGFDEITPQLQRMVSWLESHGTTVHTLEPIPTPCQQPIHHTFQHQEDELRAMFSWAHQQCQTADTTPFIGCVIPELKQIRPLVMRIAQEISQEDDYDLSAGTCLADFPLIQSALQTLQLEPPWEVTELLKWLTSPYIQSKSCPSSYWQQWQHRLRQVDHRYLDQQVLRSWLGAKAHSDPWLQALQQIYGQRANPSKRYSSQWAQHMAQTLELLGWPGQVSLSSSEYQVMMRWQQVLVDLSCYDDMLGIVSFQEAFTLLKHGTQSVEFQIQKPSAPIQILGTLEAAGLSFDALWMSHMDQDHWPSAPDPHPLIPLSLQIKGHLPHAHAKRELQFSERLLHRFQQSSPVILYSHHTQQDERILLPSQLIPKRALAQITPTWPVAIGYTMAGTAPVEWLEDSHGTALDPTESVRGGTQILKDMVACPLRAFARHRLQAVSPTMPKTHIDHRDRGMLIHRCLELFWSQVQTHSQLNTLSDDAIYQLIAQQVKLALKQHHSRYFQQENPTLIDNEQQILTQRLYHWIDYERQRQDFTIEALEQKKEVLLSGLALTLRIDRIDRLSDGSRLLIDYKSSHHSIQRWLGDEPDEPQLPLYTIADDEPIPHLAFAEVSAQRAQLHGLTARDDGFDDLQSIDTLDLTWDTLQHHWQQVLQQLAERFKQGQAQRQPKYGGQTCQQCDLQRFCRIHESQQET